MTNDWPEERLDRVRLAATEKELARVTEELARVTRELATKTQMLEAADHQIADLKRLIEVRKVPISESWPLISDYYQD